VEVEAEAAEVEVVLVAILATEAKVATRVTDHTGIVMVVIGPTKAAVEATNPETITSPATEATEATEPTVAIVTTTSLATVTITSSEHLARM
jgi:hypothetical protein